MNQDLKRTLWAAADMLDAVDSNAKLARGLAEPSDTLLPRLISGKLRLLEAQARVKGAIA